MSATSSSLSCAPPRPRPRPAGPGASEDAAAAAALLRAKLAYALARLGQVFNGAHHNIALLQVWFPDAGCCVPPKDALQADYHADPELAVMADACFEGFRTASAACHDCGRLSMPGRVFRSGCVAVVQNLRVLPACLHPRSRLAEPLADRLGDALYLPVYDLSRPEPGPAAVIEALLARHAPDSMLVANLMSFAGSSLAALQLSLSSPLPQPVLPSSLAGRRPRPAADLTDSEDDDDDDEDDAAPPPAPAKAWHRPAAGAAPPQHPGMVPPGGPPAAAKAACEPSSGAVAAAGAPALACSADSTCTVATDAAASCGAFPRAAAAALPVARAPKRAGPAATAPPDLGASAAGDDGCDMGPPRCKRPRFGSAGALGMRRTTSVSRCLKSLMAESEGEAAPMAPLYPQEC